MILYDTSGNKTLDRVVLFICFRDDIVDIEVDSKVRKIPNFVKVSTGSKTIEAGLYKKGDTSVKTLMTQTMALVRPKVPFGTTSNSFGKLIKMRDLCYLRYFVFHHQIRPFEDFEPTRHMRIKMSFHEEPKIRICIAHCILINLHKTLCISAF